MIKYRTIVGADATTEEVNAFVELVRSGGAVDEEYVRIGLVRPGAEIIFAKIGGEAVGVAALKVPSVGYRSALQSAVKADYALPENEYPYELGYVSVSLEHSRQGIARALVEEVLRLADGNGIFATTSNLAMKEGLLPSFKFIPVGKSWRNESGVLLSLLVRK